MGVFIDLTNAKAIKTTADPGGANEVELIVKANITKVIPVYMDNTASQGPDNQVARQFILQVSIWSIGDVIPLNFDIQDVSNQAGWTPNRAGLNQAITDILASL